MGRLDVGKMRMHIGAQNGRMAIFSSFILWWFWRTVYIKHLHSLVGKSESAKTLGVHMQQLTRHIHKLRCAIVLHCGVRSQLTSFVDQHGIV